MEPVRELHMLHSMNRGGAETMIMNYYRHIDREKVQFDFLLTFQGKSDYEEEILALGGKIFHVTPLTLKTMGAYFKDIERFLKEHPEYRIVHSHNSSKSVFPLRIAKKCNVPVRISHSHNMFLGNGASPKELLRKLLRTPLKKVSTHNFACSKDAAIWLYGEKYWEEGKVKVLPNAIDVTKFSYSIDVRDNYRKQFNLEDAFVVGHVGRFQEQKNHTFLLDIFAQIAKMQENAKFVLVGDGPLREEMEQKAKQLGIAKQVIFTGVREDVANLMQMMDVFVFPSLFEGLGIVLVEAQAAGLPCFTSKDVVPEEVKATEHLQFISLNESAEHWAKMVLENKDNFERKARVQEIKAAGYEIKEAAGKLERFYLEHYKK